MKFVNTPYDGVEIIEIPITSANIYKYYFPIVEKLDKKIIRRIDLVFLNSGKTPTNRDVIDKNRLVLGYMTIRPQNQITVNRLPLFYTINYANNTCFSYEIFDYPIRFDLSFVEFAQSTTLSTSESLLFVIFYNEKNKRKYVRLKDENLILNPLYKFYLGYDNVFTVNQEVIIDNIEKTKFYFNLDDRLDQGSKIKKIEFLAYGTTSPTGRTLINSTSIYQKAFLTLRDYDNNEIVNKLPLNYLSKLVNQSCEILFNDLNIDFTKSYVELSNNSSLVLNTSFFFTIYYNKRK